MDATVVVSGRLFEVVNGALFFAFLYLTLKVFGPFLFGLWREKSGYKYRWDAFHRDGGPAIALVILLLGDSIVRGLVWYQRWTFDHQFNGVAPSPFVGTVIVGVMVALAGAWCIARVYGNHQDGLMAIVISIGLAMALAYPWQ